MYSLQEWLKKKKESLRENMQQKKKEEMLKEKQKRVNNLQNIPCVIDDTKHMVITETRTLTIFLTGSRS